MRYENYEALKGKTLKADDTVVIAGLTLEVNNEYLNSATLCNDAVFNRLRIKEQKSILRAPLWLQTMRRNTPTIQKQRHESGNARR